MVEKFTPKVEHTVKHVSKHELSFNNVSDKQKCSEYSVTGSTVHSILNSVEKSRKNKLARLPCSTVKK